MEKRQRQNNDIQARSYLDWAAAAIPMPNIEEGGIIYGNPSSSHSEGRLAKEALENARSRCAAVLGVPPQKLYFTSGGTESNALFLHSLLTRKWKGQLLYSEVEHPSVRENCNMLEKLGISTGSIEVEKDGRVSESTLSKALEKHPDTRILAIMAVNNETGSLMDIKKLVSIARSSVARSEEKTKAPIHFHSDLVQAIGKVPVDLASWDLDSASFSAHKLGGPRGIGLLYLKKSFESLHAGGEQEGRIRPGTENISGALALAYVLERRANPDTLSIEEKKARERFKYLIRELKNICSAKGVQRCSLIPKDREEDDPRFSPWILQARFHDVPGAVAVRALDDAGVAVSTGSACSSNSPERPVLAAMGIDESARLEGIRISQGWTTEMADMDALLRAIEKALSFL